MSIINKLPPINFNPNAPALYGQGLTDYEILVRVCQQINECIETINSYDALAKRLDKYLSDFEETVKDNITAIITEWYENGTLKQMVQDILAPYIEDVVNRQLVKSPTLEFAHRFRAIHFTGNNWVRFPTNGNNFANCQGGCSFIDNFVEYFCECNNNGNTSQIKIYTTDNATTPFRTVNLANSHAQSCTYNPATRSIYVPYFDGSVANSAGIYRYSMETEQLELVNISRTGGHPQDITDNRWWSVKAVEEADGWKLYGFKNYGIYGDTNLIEVFLIDWENENSTLVDVCRLPKLNNNAGVGYRTYANANCCINDKYIAVLTMRPNSVVIYDRATSEITTEWEYRKPLWTYKLENVLASCYALGEVEDISLDNELNLQLVTLNDLNGTNDPNKIISQATVVRHYQTNLARGVYSFEANSVQGANPVEVTYKVNNYVPQFYVDWASTMSNPTGGFSQPFKTVGEAIEVIANCPYISQANIRLKSDQYLPAYFNCGKTISFDGGGHYMYGIYVALGNVYIKNFSKIAQSAKGEYLDGDTIKTDTHNAPLYLFGNTYVGLYQVTLCAEGVAGGQATCAHHINEQYAVCYYDNATLNTVSAGGSAVDRDIRCYSATCTPYVKNV